VCKQGGARGQCPPIGAPRAKENLRFVHIEWVVFIN